MDFTIIYFNEKKECLYEKQYLLGTQMRYAITVAHNMYHLLKYAHHSTTCLRSSTMHTRVKLILHQVRRVLF
jgi:hypothetical protein